ncbi:unnamed protein product [Arabis nemorensis]|uniref:Uncharacterized protein n=1 Tax=Arabis nemorensis TaxID=586526 RepID=A0A565CAG9_9BRAS|nr:unnamed protein product [Arabis nemorensis]
MEYSKEELPYQADEDQWSQGEERDFYPSSDIEEETNVEGFDSEFEDEPEPPDLSRDITSYQEWYIEETDQESEDGDSRIGKDNSQSDHEDEQHKNNSRIREAESQFSHEEEGYGCEQHYEDFTHKGEFTHEDESESSFGAESDCEGQDPEPARDDMGFEAPYWNSYGYPSKEAHYPNGVVPGRVHTNSSITKPWNHAYYHNQIITWGDLKQRMYKEFVQRIHNKSYIPKRLMFQTTSKSGMSTPNSQPVRNQKLPYGSEPKKVISSTLSNQTGAKQAVRGVPSEKKTFSDQNQNKEERTLSLIKNAVQEAKSVSKKIQIKEKPPDAQSIHQIRGDQVLRSKLLEDGGYDEDIQTIPNWKQTKLAGLSIKPTVLDHIASFGEFQLINMWSSPIWSSHSHLINQEVSAHGETPRRRRRSKPSFKSIMRICLEVNKESYQDTFPYFLWESGDTLDQIEALPHEPWCTLPHKNLLNHYLPFLEPNEINQQRLFLGYCCCVLKSYSVHLDVPRSHHFQPKLSRLKHPQLALYGPIFSLIFQRLSYLFSCDLFMFL